MSKKSNRRSAAIRAWKRVPLIAKEVVLSMLYEISRVNSERRIRIAAKAAHELLYTAGDMSPWGKRK